jgi:DNA-binding MarR family transcriptional regulator
LRCGAPQRTGLDKYVLITHIQFMTVLQRVQQRGFKTPAEAAVVSVMVAGAEIEQAVGAVLAAHGITLDQYNVLRILRGAYPAGHPRYDVAQRMVHPAPDVTRMLDRLARQGWVARARDSEDARLSVAKITKAGLALLERIDPEIEALEARIAASLSPAQLRRLARLCDALVT